MAATTNRGSASLGALMGNVSTQSGTQVALVESTDGPSLSYQGVTIPDIRYSPVNKESLKAGRAPGFLISPDVVVADFIPSAISTTAIAAAAAPSTDPFVFTLVTTAPGGAAGGGTSLAVVPIIPLGANNGSAFPNQGSTVSVVCPDFGFTTGTYVANNTSITVIDSSLFYPGQWIVLGGGGTSNTSSIVTQVTSITSGTVIVVATAPVAALTRGPIGSANFYGYSSSLAAGTAANPYLQGGFNAVLNPEEAVCRAVSITATNAGATGGLFKVVGYDVYGQIMHESITHAGSNTTKNGVKAFRYILSVTSSGFTDTQSYSIGTSDIFGFNLRADRFSQVGINQAATGITATTGFLAAVTTSPATAITGDVRGTYALQTASDGTRRLFMTVTPRVPAQVLANPTATTLMFGVQQF